MRTATALYFDLLKHKLNSSNSNYREVLSSINKKEASLDELITFFRENNIPFKDQAYVIYTKKYEYSPLTYLTKDELNHLAVAFFLVYQDNIIGFAPLTKILNMYFTHKVNLTTEIKDKINSNLIYISSIKSPYEWTLEELVNIDKLNMDTTIDFEM